MAQAHLAHVAAPLAHPPPLGPARLRVRPGARGAAPHLGDRRLGLRAIRVRARARVPTVS